MASLRGVHQREGVRWLCRRESDPGAVPSVAGGILADEMGLGKTHQVVALMRLRPMQTLIVTTLSTLMQWQDVIATQTGSLPLVIRGRHLALESPTSRTVLTTYSLFQRGESANGLSAVAWGRVVLDEAHLIRNPKGHTFRSLCKLCAAHRWVLTGTPIHNSVRDLQTLVQWLGAPGLDVEMIRTSLILRRTKEFEAIRNPEMSIPGLTVIDSIVTLSELERQAYLQIETSGRQHAESGSESAMLPVCKFRAMEAILRCRQACTHCGIMGWGTSVETGLAMTLQSAMRSPIVVALQKSTSSSKVQRVVELISRHSSTEKSLIFCDWCVEMDILESELTTKLGVRVLRYQGTLGLGERQNILGSFASMEDGTVLLMQIQCGCTGLNIQSASQVYMMRPAWNPCVERQAIARAHRIGQTRPVTVTRIIAADSIDVRCLAIQARKVALIDSIMPSDNDEMDMTSARELLISTCTHTQ